MRMIYVLLAILGGFGAQYLMSAEEPAYWVLAFIMIFVSFLSLLMGLILLAVCLAIWLDKVVDEWED